MLAWIVGWGLLIAWSNTFGMMLEGLANALRINAWRIHIDPAAKLRDIDHAVVGVLQGYIAASDHAIGFWFHQSARLQGWITDETVKLAQDTLHLGQWLVHSYVPAAIHDATHLLGRAVHATTTTITRVERVVVHTPAVAKAAAHAAVAPLYRTVAIPHLQTSLTIWTLSLASELVFTGDAVTTEPSRPSHRYGLELAKSAFAM